MRVEGVGVGDLDVGHFDFLQRVARPDMCHSLGR